MKHSKLFCFCITILCLVMGYWQLESLQKVWIEYRSLYKYFTYGEYFLQIADFSVPQNVAAEDPEAAAVMKVKLVCFSHLEPDQKLTTILECQRDFPDNEYILFELVKNLTPRCDEVIDPLIALRHTEKLIKLNPENLGYRLIKCHLLLADRTGNNINSVLDELEGATNCTQSQWPYQQYKKRALEIAERAKAGRFIHSIVSENFGVFPYFYDINKMLIGYANKAFTDGEEDLGFRITDALANMQQQAIEQGDSHFIACMNLRFLAGCCSFGHWNTPQGLELQRVDLDQDRANRNRLQLCSRMPEGREFSSKPTVSEEKHREKRWNVSLTVPPAVHCGKMLVAFICSAVIIWSISIKQGFGQKKKVRLSAIILFLVACFYFFCIMQFEFINGIIDRLADDFLCPCQYWTSYFRVFRPNPGPMHFRNNPAASSLILASPIIVAMVLWGLGFVRPRKGAFWRFWYLRALTGLIAGAAAGVFEFIESGNWIRIGAAFTVASILMWLFITFAWYLLRLRLGRLLLLTTFLGTAGLFLRSIPYIQYIPMMMFILTAALVAHIKPGQDSVVKSVGCYFSKDAQVADLRRQCFVMTVLCLVLYWLIFAALTPFVAKAINLECEPIERSPKKIVFVEPKQAYANILNKFQQEKITDKATVYRYLGFIMPDDLPSVLQTLKKAKFVNYSFRMSMGLGPNASDSKQKKYQSLTDVDWASALRSCGRDTIHIISDFTDNPESDHMLVARARLGDAVVKQKLEHVYQERVRGNSDKSASAVHTGQRKVHTADIIGALACISEPNDALRYYLDYMNSSSISDLVEAHYLFDNIQLLPTEQVREVIKAYLVRLPEYKAKDFRGKELDASTISSRKLLLLYDIVGLYGDAQIAEEVLKIQLLTDEEDFRVMDFSQYLTVNSIPLLKKGLLTKNNKLRAWCLWQLRKLNYDWKKAEIEKLLGDKDWRVRNNAQTVR